MADITLYHGTTKDSADALLASGWAPNSWTGGGNCGQRHYLYLTNGAENAMWFANEKGGDTVVEVSVPEECLKVDPEDGIADTVALELANHHGLPGSVVLTRALPADRFRKLPSPMPGGPF